MTTHHLSIEKTLALENKIQETILLNDDCIIITHNNQFSAINANLELMWTKPADLKAEGYVYPTLNIHPNGQLYAICNINSVRFFTIENELLFTYEHEAWASFLGTECFFTTQYALFVAPSETGDKLVVVSLSNYSVINTYPLDANQEINYTFVATPDPKLIFLDWAAGQDDTRQFKLEINNDGELKIEEISSCNDRIFGAFSPSGTEFVTAPHYDEGIEVHSFPAMETIGDLPQETLFENSDEEYPSENEDSLNYSAIYLNNETLLTISRFGRLLLINRKTMTLTGQLTLEGCALKAFNANGDLAQPNEEIEEYEGEVSDIKLLPNNRILVRHTKGHLNTYNLKTLPTQ